MNTNMTTMPRAEKAPAPAWPYLARTMKEAPSSSGCRVALGTRVCVYAAGCPGLQHLGVRARAALHKVGVTSASLQHRLKQMSTDRYGSLYKAVGGGLVSSPGFDDWSAQPLDVTLHLNEGSPVRVESRGLIVTLPADLTVRDFDLHLARALGGISAATVARSTSGQRWCRELGVDSASLQRVTAYDFGGPVRHSAAQEIVFFRPRLDSNHLVVVVERIIADHLALRRAHRLTA